MVGSVEASVTSGKDYQVPSATRAEIARHNSVSAFHDMHPVGSAQRVVVRIPRQAKHIQRPAFETLRAGRSTASFCLAKTEDWDLTSIVLSSIASGVGYRTLRPAFQPFGPCIE